MTRRDFTSAYLPLREDLYRVAYYILESQQDAEDAVQDLYLRLYSSPEALDSVRNPRAYCLTLIRNICIDRIRKARSGRYDGSVEPASDETPQDERLSQRQQLEQVLKRMSRLSPREQEVLRMKVLDELSYGEIKARTGLSQLNLRVTLSNARRKMRLI